MKYEEKLRLLKEKHLNIFLETREKVEEELSASQPLFCCCGKLATGLHERYCAKFQKKVNMKTVERLEQLVVDNNPVLYRYSVSYHIHNGKRPIDYEVYTEIIEAISIKEAYQIALLRATTPGTLSEFPVTIYKKDIKRAK